MCRFVAILFATILTAYSTISAVVGLLSATWWTGYRNVGIASYCYENSAVKFGNDYYKICSSFDWDTLANIQEQSMVCLLVAAAGLGSLALLILLCNCLCACFCINLAGTCTAALIIIEGLCILATCILMASNYEWGYPLGTQSLGSAYILNIVAVPVSFIAASLTFVYHQPTTDNDYDNNGYGNYNHDNNEHHNYKYDYTVSNE
eukprot:CFRG7147T1